MSNLKNIVTELDQMTAKGEILDALETYYSANSTFEEPDGSRREGRKAQHDHLSGFFSTLKSFNGAKIHGTSVGDNITMSEFTFDMTGGDGEAIIWNEVLVRRWKDDQVIGEKFYQA